MVRYSPKNNDIMFGWESIFRTINSTRDALPEVTDIDYVFNIESIDVSELKAKPEQNQPWFVGNSTRLPSYTYNTEYKIGSGSLSGQLKHAHCIDAVLAATAVVDETTYDDITIEGMGDGRKSFFIAFNHGTARSKSLGGCYGVELTVEGKENDYVTFDMPIMSAIMIDNRRPMAYGLPAFPNTFAGTETFTIASKTATMGAATHTTVSSLIAAVNVALAGATASAITEVECVATRYYSAGWKDGIAFRAADGVTSFILTDGTGTPFASALLFNMDGYTTPQTYPAGDLTPNVGQVDISTSPFHWKHVAVEFSIGGVIKTGDDPEDDYQVESFKVNVKNNTEYKFGAPNTGAQQHATWIKETNLEYELELVMYPTDDEMWTLGPAENDYIEQLVGVGTIAVSDETSFVVGDTITGATSGAVGIVTSISTEDQLDLKNVVGTFTTETINGSVSLAETTTTAVFVPDASAKEVACTITLQRDTDDYIEIEATDLVIGPLPEQLSAITDGVDPITVTMKPAKKSSTLYAYAHDPLHDNSYSLTY